MTEQLTFLDTLFPAPEKENYWKRFFNWDPKVGELARIDTTVAFCETIGMKAYCYCMRVEVVEINGDTAKVRTTKDWEDACRVAGSGGSANSEGNIWIVQVEDLAKILEE